MLAIDLIYRTYDPVHYGIGDSTNSICVRLSFLSGGY